MKKIFYDEMDIEKLRQELVDLEAEIACLREVSMSFETCSAFASLPFIAPMQLFAYIQKRDAVLEIIETRQG